MTRDIDEIMKDRVWEREDEQGRYQDWDNLAVNECRQVDETEGGSSTEYDKLRGDRNTAVVDISREPADSDDTRESEDGYDHRPVHDQPHKRTHDRVQRGDRVLGLVS